MVVSVSVLRVAQTTPEIYCVKIRTALPDFREKCSETRKVVDSVSVLRGGWTIPGIYCNNDPYRVKITYPLRSSAL